MSKNHANCILPDQVPNKKYNHYSNTVLTVCTKSCTSAKYCLCKRLHEVTEGYKCLYYPLIKAYRDVGPHITRNKMYV